MPQIAGVFQSPFYRQVDGPVKNELNARAAYYGAKVRGSGADRTAKSVMWSYGKKPWVRIQGDGATLGNAFGNVMSNRNGQLTLYSAQRNQPKFPLLKSLELSNEGTMGSLLKGKFTFVMYPTITNSGFVMGQVENAFFTPGKEVSIRWGWSVYASNAGACTGFMRGIIYNFNWSVNPDLSIVADCQVVSAATVATGMSGDQTNPDQQGTPPSTAVTVLGQPLAGSNLASVIDKDFADPAFPAATVAQGQQVYINPTTTATQKLEYFAIGLPFQATEPESVSTDPANTQTAQEKAAAPPAPIPKVFYYVKLGSITQFVNNLILALEGGAAGGTVGRLFRVASFGNVTAHNPVIRSSSPIEVYFPDGTMGEYGPTLNPFATGGILAGVPGGVVNAGDINIGQILLGTDFVKETYKKFVEDNSANIPYKNITSFFEEICKKINECTGDCYQLTANLFEQEGAGRNPGQCILSIEDTNLSKSITDTIQEFVFGVNIYRPLIKSASITCKPPAASAAAAYTSARAQSTPTGHARVNADVQNTPASLRTGDQILSGAPLGAATAIGIDAKGEIFAKKDGAVAAGFNKSWAEQFRGLLQKYKKFQTVGSPGAGGPQDGHWLNAAIYPIDLTLTIDGIDGFKFGDTIKCMAIPARYNRTPWETVFTIVKINHVIDDSKWETTITTKARINFG